jgi:soluble lytic murein transglycosylase-like protein
MPRARTFLARSAVAFGAAFALVGWAPPARAADIYRCPSEDGGWHFTNVSVREGCVRIMRVPDPQPAAPAPAAPDPAAAEVERASGLMRYETVIARAGARHRVEPALIKAVIRTESNFNPNAVSRKGALGLMQLMPATATRYGVPDPFEPEANIEGGVRYLRTLIDRYGEANLDLVLAAYNAGEDAVERHGRRIPPYAETQGYVQAVKRHYETYRGQAAQAAGAVRAARAPAAPAGRGARLAALR